MQQSVLQRRIATNWSPESAAICLSAPNCDKLVPESAVICPSATNCDKLDPRKCSNLPKRDELRQIGPAKVQQSVVARRIATNWSRESAAICRSAPNCDKFVPRKCSNLSKRDELRQIGHPKVQQSVLARRIATNWSRESAAICPSATNCDKLVRDSAVICLSAQNCDKLVPRKCSDLSKRDELRQIGHPKLQQSVLARRIATNWSRESAAICRSAPNCDKLVPRKCSNRS